MSQMPENCDIWWEDGSNPIILSDSWLEKFKELTQLVASWSKDRSTKVGAIIVSRDNRVISTGYNGFPINCDDDVDERHERPAKYLWTEHAERNALYAASSYGISTNGLIMITTMFPCADCARGIIQSGIDTLYTTAPSETRWDESHKVSTTMLKESGVSIIYIQY
jgi:dCMP deaminase